MSGARTNAIRRLAEAGIECEVLEYDLSEEDFSAEAVAAQLGIPPDQVFKTLVAVGPGGPVLAVVPAASELDLKRLAAHLGARKVSLAATADLMNLTGFRRGAVTALGLDRGYPVVLDELATVHDRIAVSAGARGVQVRLTVGDYCRLTGADVADIAR